MASSILSGEAKRNKKSENRKLFFEPNVWAESKSRIQFASKSIESQQWTQFSEKKQEQKSHTKFEICSIIQDQEFE